MVAANIPTPDNDPDAPGDGSTDVPITATTNYVLTYLVAMERCRVFAVMTANASGVQDMPPPGPLAAMTWYLTEPSDLRLAWLHLQRALPVKSSGLTAMHLASAYLALEWLLGQMPEITAKELQAMMYLPLHADLVTQLCAVEESRLRRGIALFPARIHVGTLDIMQQRAARTASEQLNPLAVKCWLAGALDHQFRMVVLNKDKELEARLRLFIDGLLGRKALL